MMGALKNCAATAASFIAAVAVNVARVMTSRQVAAESRGRTGGDSTLVLVTPLAPSEKSGGGRAVKDLYELFSEHLDARLVELPDVAAAIPEARKRWGLALLQGVPALRTSMQCLFAASEVGKRLPVQSTVFIEFAEGALFLLFRPRLPHRTILRDHEVLLRRFGLPGGRSTGWTERARAASLYYLCRSLLANIYSKVDLVVTLTETDKRFIEQRFSVALSEVVTIPAPFRIPAHRGAPETGTVAPSTCSRDLLFVANLFHAPNLEALLWFLRECAPHLEVGFTLHLCGLDGPLNGMNLETGHLTVVRHGFLDDIEATLGTVRIGIAPVVSGGGTRIKNLYLGSTGRAIVTTPLGNEGIGFVDGLDAIIRSDGRAMASALNEIARDPERLCRLGEWAARRVREQYSPERIWGMYEEKVFFPSTRLTLVAPNTSPGSGSE